MLRKSQSVKRHYGWVPDLPDHRDYTYSAPPVVLGRLPPRVDLRRLRSAPQREYAEIGGRLYTEHAVGRMLPSGMGGRGIAPAFIEDAIATGTTSTHVVAGVTRTVYTSGTVQVVTEEGGRIVVTVNPFSGGR